MTQDNIMLEISGLSKVYSNAGDAISGGVRQANFVLQAGTFFTLLGPSGCGKTTTLRCIAGLEQPDSGIIRVGGETFFSDADNVSVPLNRRNIGMVFQSYAIWPHMTVFENVAFPLRVAKDRSYSAKEIKSLTNTALETVSLGGFGDRSATMLSGGQQQRVALARAIVRRPRLLLLDEPLSNLDASLRDELRQELRNLQKQIGVTTVYVTHDQSEALEMSDQIAVMEKGHIVQLATPKEVYFRPASRFVAEFVGTTNWITAHVTASTETSVSATTDAGETVQGTPTPGSPVAKRIKMSIRPESIRILAGDTAATAGVNTLMGNVIFVGFAGSMTRLIVDIGHSKLQICDTSVSNHRIGDVVTLSFSKEDVLTFADDR
jgi:iron(III) transport system ATP-binding protein